MAKNQPEKWKELLLKALEKSLGIVTPACKEVGISRDRFYTYYNEDPKFRAEVDKINDIQGDFVESQLFRKIKEGSERSIHFYLKYKGRNRGYKDSIDLTTKGDKITEIKLIQVERDGTSD